MSRIGTCLFCHEIQEMRLPPPAHQPHLRDQVVTLPGIFLCQFLCFQEGPLPPPVERVIGAFEIRESDCESCCFYRPAAAFEIEQLMKVRRRRRARRNYRRAMKVQKSG